MIQELVEFGKRVTQNRNMAFCEEAYSLVLVIDKEGNFQSFRPIEGVVNTALVTEHNNSNKKPKGVITAKQGHARFLLDKSAEVLGIGGNAIKKHNIFITITKTKNQLEYHIENQQWKKKEMKASGRSG